MPTDSAASPPPAHFGLRERARSARRAAIIRAAFELFEDAGLDAVTVADICARAELSPRTFFRYFPSKEDLLDEPARQMYIRLAETIAAADPAQSDSRVITDALIELGDLVLGADNHLLASIRIAEAAAIEQSRSLAGFLQVERDLAMLLERRRGADDTSIPGWRTRLTAARALTGYRVWLDDLLAGVPDPLGHLRAVLTAAL